MSDSKQIVKSDNPSPSSSLDEILDGVPAEDRETIEKFMLTSFKMGGVISPENTLLDKVTGEHISQYLDGSKIQMEKDYQEKLHRKIFTLIFSVIAMAFVIVIILLLKDNPDVMEKVIYAVGGLIAGGLGGYGIGKVKKDDQ